MRIVQTRHDGYDARTMLIDAKVDHVAVAVRDMRRAMPLWVDALGARFLFAGDRIDQGFRWAQFALPGGGKVELVTAINPNGFVARFIDRRGEGVHHVTLKVDDIEGAIARLAERGIPLFNVSTASAEWKEAFVHPRDANGTLIQLAQSSVSDEDMARHHLRPHEESDHRHVSLEELLQLPSDLSVEGDRT